MAAQETKNKIKIIEGNPNLVFHKSGNVNNRNKYVDNLFDMHDVEFWEDRLDQQKVEYCLTYHYKTGYTIFVDYNKIVDNQNHLC